MSCCLIEKNDVWHNERLPDVFHLPLYVPFRCLPSVWPQSLHQQKVSLPMEVDFVEKVVLPLLSGCCELRSTRSTWTVCALTFSDETLLSFFVTCTSQDHREKPKWLFYSLDPYVAFCCIWTNCSLSYLVKCLGWIAKKVFLAMNFISTPQLLYEY